MKNDFAFDSEHQQGVAKFEELNIFESAKGIVAS